MNEVAKVSVPALAPSAPITKLPIQAGGAVSAIIPRTIDEAFRMAEAVCAAGMVPDSYKGADDRATASKVLMGIMKGMEVGLPPITALSNIYIVNNRPSIWGDGALAVVQNHPDYAGCVEMIEGKPETDTYTATCTIRRKTGAEINTTTRTFSWADAKRASLVNKGPWRQYPQRMLQMRARAWCIRDSFADALSGLQIREEIEDMNVKPEVVATAFLDEGPAAVASTAAAPAPVEPSDDYPEVDQAALFETIKRSFIAAGDDAKKVAECIQAAEALDLPEPQASELSEIIEAKRAKAKK